MFPFWLSKWINPFQTAYYHDMVLLDILRKSTLGITCTVMSVADYTMVLVCTGRVKLNGTIVWQILLVLSHVVCRSESSADFNSWIFFRGLTIRSGVIGFDRQYVSELTSDKLSDVEMIRRKKKKPTLSFANCLREL